MMIKVLVVLAVVASAMGFKMNMKTGTINLQFHEVEPIIRNSNNKLTVRHCRNAIIQQVCLRWHRWTIRLWKYQHARPGADES